MPKLSVLFPHYNHGQYVRKSIPEILNQSFTDFELIIVDDASREEDFQILKKVAEGDSRIKLFRRSQNGGVDQAMMQVYAEARGEYVYFASADDGMEKSFFEDAIRLLDQNQDRGAFASNPSYYKCEGDYWYKTYYLNIDKQEAWTPEQFIENLNSNCVSGATFLFRKKALDSLHQFRDKRLGYLSDLFTSMVVAFSFGICVSPKDYIYIRDADDSMHFRDHQNQSKNELIAEAFCELLGSEHYQSLRPFFEVSGTIVPFILQVDIIRLQQEKRIASEMISLIGSSARYFESKRNEMRQKKSLLKQQGDLHFLNQEWNLALNLYQKVNEITIQDIGAELQRVICMLKLNRQEEYANAKKRVQYIYRDNPEGLIKAEEFLQLNS